MAYKPRFVWHLVWVGALAVACTEPAVAPVGAATGDVPS